jgi:hypothetical protein
MSRRFKTTRTLRNKQHKPIKAAAPLEPSCSIVNVLRNLESLKSIYKSQFEIVITRFKEPLEWTRGIEHLCTVYNKGPTLEFAGTVLNVPNYGLGVETLLRHIITNYHNLAAITMFSQASLVDRVDQAMFNLTEYYKQCSVNSVFGNTAMATDPADSRYPGRLTNPSCSSIGDRDLSAFRKDVVKIPYRYFSESWVRGEWMSVGRDRIRSKPLSYYRYLYAKCEFFRGNQVEELWFLERSFYSIFTEPVQDLIS